MNLSDLTEYNTHEIKELKNDFKTVKPIFFKQLGDTTHRMIRKTRVKKLGKGDPVGVVTFEAPSLFSKEKELVTYCHFYFADGSIIRS